LTVIELTAGFQNIRDNYLPKGLWLNIGITACLMVGLVIVIGGSVVRWRDKLKTTS
jgi:hypothetical protein